MRLPSIERGARLRDRLLYGAVRRLAGQRIPDVVRTLRFPPERFGTPMNEVFHAVMRGPSEGRSASASCSRRGCRRRTSASFERRPTARSRRRCSARSWSIGCSRTPDSAGVSDRVRTALRLLAKVTRDHGAVTADDVRPLLAAGVTRQGVVDALMVGYAFNIITRMADTFRFDIPGPEGFEMSAKRLLGRGYK